MPTLNAFINYNTRESDRASGIETSIDPNNPVTLSDTPIGVVGSSGESVFGYEPNILGLRELDALPFTEQLYLNVGDSCKVIYIPTNYFSL